MMLLMMFFVICPATMSAVVMFVMVVMIILAVMVRLVIAVMGWIMFAMMGLMRGRVAGFIVIGADQNIFLWNTLPVDDTATVFRGKFLRLFHLLERHYLGLAHAAHHPAEAAKEADGAGALPVAFRGAASRLKAARCTTPTRRST